MSLRGVSCPDPCSSIVSAKREGIGPAAECYYIEQRAGGCFGLSRGRYIIPRNYVQLPASAVPQFRTMFRFVNTYILAPILPSGIATHSKAEGFLLDKEFWGPYISSHAGSQLLSSADWMSEDF